MELLLNQYEKQSFTISGKNENFDEFKAFEDFYVSKLNLIVEWLDCIFKKKETKNNLKADELRKQGNTFFVKKDYEKCMQYYTLSSCFSEQDTESYVLSYSNKSAVFLERNDFKSCLKCINLCLKLPCPELVKLKLLLRKCECFFHLNYEQELEQSIHEAIDYINKYKFSNLEEQEKYLNKIEKFQDKSQKKIETVEDITETSLPVPKDGFSNSFLFASSSINIQETETKGRSVFANNHINVGEVLFVEKAFSFAPVLPDEKNEFLQLNKCFHCLSDVKVCLPCHSCTVAIYCDENCRTNAWQQCHQWECPGIQTRLWKELGIGYPAFRTLLKGLPSNFENLPPSYNFSTLPFGDKENNYPYFNSLVTNFSKMENVAKIVVKSAVIVHYLSKHTNFFEKKCPNESDEFKIKIGGLLCRHIAQLMCNSSVVHHSLSPSNPTEQTAVACGIYPSISIMNHSCDPNITIYYVKDVAIVKSIQEIKEGSEVFNCYGMDYRYFNKYKRTEKCREVYYFTCDCFICKNPQLEIENYESFRCEICEGPLSKTPLPKYLKCTTCSKLYDPPINDVEKKILSLYEGNNDEEYVLSCFEEFKNLLYVKHSCFSRIYSLLAEKNFEKGDFQHLVMLSKLFIEQEKIRYGNYNKTVGLLMKVLFIYILICLKDKDAAVLLKFRKEINDISEMFEEMKIILNLYFHLPKNYFEDLEVVINTFNFILQIN